MALISNNIYYIFISFVIINILNPILTTISIPFTLKFINSYLYYNSSYYLNDNFKKNLLLELNIGTPPQKITALLNQNISCLSFDDGQLGNYNYFPIKSSSFKINDRLNDYNRLKIGNEIFHFSNNIKYNLNFLLLKNSSSLNKMYNPVIGLNVPYYYIQKYMLYPCNNFLYDLKRAKVIKKNLYSIKYNNKTNGEFIIGDDLYEYDPINFPQSKFSTIYYNLFMSIYFELIYIYDKTNNINYILNSNNSNLYNTKSEAYINLNLGFIIGTNEYKNYIDKIFFNKLIKNNICKIEIIKYNPDNNDIDKRFINNDFYLYSCNKDFSGGKKSKNYYIEFPILKFSSKKIEYNFVFTNEDLFEQISEKYYFLIIFKKSENHQNEQWYLGEPFYKKYSFTTNLDSRTIGFYLDEKNLEDNINDIQDINKKDINNNVTKDDENIINRKININIKNIVKYTIAVCVGIFALFIAYYIGVTVREKRRKRANELKDDNYEYMPEKNKDINNDNNDLKKQFVELNSRLGIA